MKNKIVESLSDAIKLTENFYSVVEAGGEYKHSKNSIDYYLYYITLNALIGDRLARFSHPIPDNCIKTLKEKGFTIKTAVIDNKVVDNCVVEWLESLAKYPSL